MSYRIGIDTINLRMTERVARTEYLANQAVADYYAAKYPGRALAEILHLDYMWMTNDGPLNWGDTGRVTDMGHAVYAADGSDYRPLQASPFAGAEDVLNFNATQEYGLPDFRELVAYYDDFYRTLQGRHDQVVSGGYYKTIVSGAIQAFGWERLLEAAGEDPQRFCEDVLGSIFEYSRFYYRAWAETSIEVFMCHDDMVWTEGPFMHPDLYRQYIFPRYQELWKPLKDAGKRILFTADGTYDMFIDDLVDAGADGFCFEPTNDLEMLVRRFGQTHVLIGGTDCRTLTFGTPEDIEREMRWVFDLGRPCPGYFFVTGNHFPANIPLENALCYFELIEELGKR